MRREEPFLIKSFISALHISMRFLFKAKVFTNFLYCELVNCLNLFFLNMKYMTRSSNTQFKPTINDLEQLIISSKKKEKPFKSSEVPFKPLDSQ